MSDNDNEGTAAPKPKPHGRFQQWLALVEAHAARKTAAEAPHPRCVHGRPWDNCEDCGTATDIGGEA